MKMHKKSLTPVADSEACNQSQVQVVEDLHVKTLNYFIHKCLYSTLTNLWKAI